MHIESAVVVITYNRTFKNTNRPSASRVGYDENALLEVCKQSSKPGQVYSRFALCSYTLGNLLTNDYPTCSSRGRPEGSLFNSYYTEVSGRALLLSLDCLFVLVSRLFANGPGDLGSIPGHVIPKALKMILDTPLLNTQKYNVRIKGKVEQSRERSIALPFTSV